MSGVQGWRFEISEESAGHFCAKGRGPGGMTVERHSADPAYALSKAIADAADLNDRAGS